MEDFLIFTGPVKLLIVEIALLTGKNRSMKEGKRKILTRLIMGDSGKLSSELKESSIIEYIYNEHQQLVILREKEKTGQILNQTNFTYSEGNLIKKEFLTDGRPVHETREFKYDKNGCLQFEKCGSRRFKYEHDETGNLKKEYRYFGKEPELALLFQYDINNKLIEIKTVNSRGNQIRLERFTWEKDLLSSHFCLNEKNVILKDDIFEYSCFHDGNWLKRVKYSLKSKNTREPVDVIYRSITYSDNYPELKPMEHNNLEILKEDKKSLSFSDGSTYRGSLVDGNMNGRGFIQWADGSSYKGEFKENKMDGEGILSWPNGDIYSGSFSDGLMDGIGRLRWKAGKTFYGLFEKNKRTNQGIIEEDE